MSFRKIIVGFLAYAVFAGSFGFKFYHHFCADSEQDNVVLTEKGSCCGEGNCSGNNESKASNCCKLTSEYVKVHEGLCIPSLNILPDVAFFTNSHHSLFLQPSALVRSKAQRLLFDPGESPPRKHGLDLLTSIGTLLV